MHWTRYRQVDTSGLDAVNDGQKTEIAVHDEGVGISKEAQQQLFQPFFSTRGDLGNGLGLYISREIIERHGSLLQVDSKPGVGTTARISLPLNPN